MKPVLNYTLLFVFVFSAVSAQSPPSSPCPQVMQYQPYGSQWVGIIQAPNPPPYGSQMKLSIKMSIAAQLPSQYVGKVDFADDTNTILQKINSGSPIIYVVHFPLTYPIPNMVQIIFDNRVICSGPSAVGPVTTMISLERVLNSGSSAVQNKRPINSYPQQNNIQEQNLNNYQPQQNTINIISYPNQQQQNQGFDVILPDKAYYNPTTTTTTTPRYVYVPETTTMKQNTYNKPPMYNTNSDQMYDTYNSIIESSSVCGVSGEDLVPLIYGGDETTKGDWPWLTAIYSNKRSLNFICAGSLISNRVVLTAAHCSFNKDNTPVKPSNLVVRVGVHDLRNFADPTSQIVNVMSIIAHSRFREGTKLANDIAIFKLSVMLTFNQYIKPVCLWSGDSNQEFVFGKLATVIGWGQDETGEVTTSGPRKLNVPIVSTTTCKLSKLGFYEFTGNTTICAGAKDGTGPCKGDSGGGLYVKQNNKWTIRGIVSFALPGNGSDCDLNEYAVYTDVALYTSWINQV